MKELFRYNKDWPYHASAGAVVFSADSSKLAALYRGAHKLESEGWHLPKGTIENGESIEQTAIREVREEAGLDIEIVGYLGSISREYDSPTDGELVIKTIHYFIGRLIRDTGKIDNEHDRVDWLTPAEAIKKTSLQPKKEDEIIKRALLYKEKFL
ncbi:MAG: NUDIX domain-containing protein [bacterium]